MTEEDFRDPPSLDLHQRDLDADPRASLGVCTFLLSIRTSWRYTNRALEDLKLMTFRLAALDVAFLDAISSKLGLSSRADALRYAIRRTAEAEGFQARPAKPKPKRRQAAP